MTDRWPDKLRWYDPWYDPAFLLSQAISFWHSQQRQIAFSGSSLKVPYHALLGFIIEFEGATRIGLHACMLNIPLIILSIGRHNVTEVKFECKQAVSLTC